MSSNSECLILGSLPTNFLRKSDRTHFAVDEESAYMYSYYLNCQARLPYRPTPSAAEEINTARREVTTVYFDRETYLNRFVHGETVAHLHALAKQWEELTASKRRQEDRFVERLNEIDGLDQYMHFMQHGTGKLKPPSKSNEARIQAQRCKQIQYGYATREYRMYRKTVPMNQRRRGDPMTPDPKEPISKRNYESQIQKWRRDLHRFDPKISLRAQQLREILKSPERVILKVKSKE